MSIKVFNSITIPHLKSTIRMLTIQIPNFVLVSVIINFQLWIDVGCQVVVQTSIKFSEIF